MTKTYTFLWATPHSLGKREEGGTMPSLGGTALAVGCLSESMEGALREHGVLGRVARAITKMYDFLRAFY